MPRERRTNFFTIEVGFISSNQKIEKVDIKCQLLPQEDILPPYQDIHPILERVIKFLRTELDLYMIEKGQQSKS